MNKNEKTLFFEACKNRWLFEESVKKDTNALSIIIHMVKETKIELTKKEMKEMADRLWYYFNGHQTDKRPN